MLVASQVVIGLVAAQGMLHSIAYGLTSSVRKAWYEEFRQQAWWWQDKCCGPPQYTPHSQRGEDRGRGDSWPERVSKRVATIFGRVDDPSYVQTPTSEHVGPSGDIHEQLLDHSTQHDADHHIGPTLTSPSGQGQGNHPVPLRREASGESMDVLDLQAQRGADTSALDRWLSADCSPSGNRYSSTNTSKGSSSIRRMTDQRTSGASSGNTPEISVLVDRIEGDAALKTSATMADDNAEFLRKTQV